MDLRYRIQVWGSSSLYRGEDSLSWQLCRRLFMTLSTVSGEEDPCLTRRGKSVMRNRHVPIQVMAIRFESRSFLTSASGEGQHRLSTGLAQAAVSTHCIIMVTSWIGSWTMTTRRQTPVLPPSRAIWSTTSVYATRNYPRKVSTP